MKVKNSKGQIYYGMHFYPGVAEYREPTGEAFRVYLNENTLRAMDPSFAGRPVFVQHVEAVEENVDQLRNDADGWVIESFFNQADGKHWVKFIVTSSRGEEAVKNGFKLSNAYFQKKYGVGGEWNGVAYEREITEGEFEHLAIVDDPRYNESEILTPEQFKAYNERNHAEVKRLANSKDKPKEKSEMKFNLFKREKTKLENSIDSDTMLEVTVKGKDGKDVTKEVAFQTIVNSFVKAENMHGYANGDHLVKVGNDEMSVNDLVKKHMEMSAENDNTIEDDEMAEEDSEDLDNSEEQEEHDMQEVGDRGGDHSLENAEDEEDEMPKPKKDEKAKNSKAKQAALIAAKNAKLRNARANREESAATVELSSDKIARGKSRYGSN